jgi:hypothetical protein
MPFSGVIKTATTLPPPDQRCRLHKDSGVAYTGLVINGTLFVYKLDSMWYAGKSLETDDLFIGNVWNAELRGTCPSRPTASQILIAKFLRAQCPSHRQFFALGDGSYSGAINCNEICGSDFPNTGYLVSPDESTVSIGVSRESPDCTCFLNGDAFTCPAQQPKEEDDF